MTELAEAIAAAPPLRRSRGRAPREPPRPGVVSSSRFDARRCAVPHGVSRGESPSASGFRWHAAGAGSMLQGVDRARSRPMPLPQIRLRTLMIAVAVGCVLLGIGVEAGRLYRVSQEYQTRAAFLRLEEGSLRAQQAILSKTIAAQDATGGDRALACGDALGELTEELRIKAGATHRRLGYVTSMRRKYERAASRPWHPVSPDPPEPPR